MDIANEILASLRDTPSDRAIMTPSSARHTGPGTYRTLGSVGFNGEKNSGELGPVNDYYLEYELLRARSWQLYLESEIAQTVLKRFTTWVIGRGLKLQAEPIKNIFKSEGISMDVHAFSEDVEARFNTYAKSRMSDYSNMGSLNMKASEAFSNSIIGGDVLVVLRIVEDVVKVQLIDGAHIMSPPGYTGSEFFPIETGRGNRVVHGIEINKKGEHVAYHVRKGGLASFETERIPARGNSSGVLLAYMVYGGKYRLDSHRGMPILAVLFETAKKLERYKEATVGSAEERAKIVYSVEHKEFSTGENPLIEQTAIAYDADRKSGAVPVSAEGEALANKVAATTNKQAFNLPIGSSLKALVSKNELYFKDYYNVNIDLFCAAAEIPPNVAMSKYEDSFSASRAALKDWENTLLVRRSNFSFQFYQPIYELNLEIDIMTGKIKAPGYTKARITKNDLLVEAFRNARWVGAPVPHIDPEKEVNAERIKLGETGKSIPLTTVEAATEALNGGDSNANLEQYSSELERSKKLGLEVEEKVAPANPSKEKPKPKPKKN